MTEEQIKIASEFLMKKRGFRGDGVHMPKTYIVGNKVCIFKMAAIREQRNHYVLTGCKLPIETMTFEQAFEEKFKIPTPHVHGYRIDRYIDLKGCVGEFDYILQWQLDMMDGKEFRKEDYSYLIR